MLLNYAKDIRVASMLFMVRHGNGVDDIHARDTEMLSMLIFL